MCLLTSYSQNLPPQTWIKDGTNTAGVNADEDAFKYNFNIVHFPHNCTIYIIFNTNLSHKVFVILYFYVVSNHALILIIIPFNLNYSSNHVCRISATQDDAYPVNVEKLVSSLKMVNNWGRNVSEKKLKNENHYRPQGRRTIGRPKKRWREQLCNSGDGTDQRVQSLMFMIIMMTKTLCNKLVLNIMPLILFRFVRQFHCRFSLPVFCYL